MTQADGVYTAASDTEIFHQMVSHAGAATFAAAATQLLRTIGDVDEGSAWAVVAAVVRRARWRLSTLPLPLGHASLGFSACADVLAGKLDELAEAAEPGRAEALFAAAVALAELSECPEDPFGDAARGFLSLDDPAESVCVILDQQHCEAVASSFRERGCLTPVVPQSVLVRERVYSSAAVTSSSRWLRPGLLNAPRASNLLLVHFDFFRDDCGVEPLLDFGPVKRTAVTRAVPSAWSSAPASPAEALPSASDIDPTSVQPHEIGNTLAADTEDGPHSDELCEARMLVLADGSRAYFESAAESVATLVEIGQGGEPAVRHELTSHLLPGMYVALRHHRDSEAVRALADSLLGSVATDLRLEQETWKAALRRRIQRHPSGAGGVTRELRARGAATVNLGYWTSDGCIRTRRLEDFRIVLGYIGMGEDADGLWNRLAEIDRAHRRAGHPAPGALEHALGAAEAEQLRMYGWCDVRPSSATGDVRVAEIWRVLPGTVHVRYHQLATRKAVQH